VTIRYKDLPVNYEKCANNEVVVRYDDTTPVDRFDIFFSLPDGWLAWCVDTMSMEIKKMRREIVKDLNSANPTKPRVRFCWHCGAKLHGNHFKEVEVDGNLVVTHKNCGDADRECRDERR
jgi:hypothetical protein